MINNLPVPYGQDYEKIITLVNRILSEKNNDRQVDTSVLENELDQIIYQLYELTPEEIQIVEESVKR